MRLDIVHDLQETYRQTLDSMSRPGLINNFRNQADMINLEISCFRSTFVFVMMLMDTEVNFKVYSKRAGEMSKLINQLTYARATEVEKANYILVLHDAKPGDLEKAFRMAYPGNLLNPHEAATIIIEADSLSNDQDLILRGPGIEEEHYIQVGIYAGWERLRAEKNSEYPLGVDLIFTDQEHNILCLPRTTQIKKQVVG